MKIQPMSEPLREQQGCHHEDHHDDGGRQTDGVDGAHSRSTAFTTNPKTTKIAIVRATKMTSPIRTPQLDSATTGTGGCGISKPPF
ncbi:hypothetical protein [Nonomuraea sp. NPDC050310]|uniref:hypothetical protein n=1 Tax=unclassified Nonomuraea TaxID=2593643 RepID=UPI0033DA350B